MMDDDDLEPMSRAQLIAEVRKLRGGIREHRDSTTYELCWHHPALWGLLPEKTDPVGPPPSALLEDTLLAVSGHGWHL